LFLLLFLSLGPWEGGPPFAIEGEKRNVETIIVTLLWGDFSPD